MLIALQAETVKVIVFSLLSRYDDVLVNGLPTWRQPIYYYRKVRKFGFTESAMVIVVTVAVIHFAMLWAAYWERKYTIVR